MIFEYGHLMTQEDFADKCAENNLDLETNYDERTAYGVSEGDKVVMWKEFPDMAYGEIIYSEV